MERHFGPRLRVRLAWLQTLRYHFCENPLCKDSPDNG